MFLVPWFTTIFIFIFFLIVEGVVHYNYHRSSIFPAGKFFFGLQDKAVCLLLCTFLQLAEMIIII